MTHPLVAIRRAPRLDSYPPLHGEAREALCRVEPCACGTPVALWRDETVTRAVQAHNTTPAHRAYRAMLEAT